MEDWPFDISPPLSPLHTLSPSDRQEIRSIFGEVSVVEEPARNIILQTRVPASPTREIAISQPGLDLTRYADRTEGDSTDLPSAVEGKIKFHDYEGVLRGPISWMQFLIGTLINDSILEESHHDIVRHVFETRRYLMDSRYRHGAQVPVRMNYAAPYNVILDRGYSTESLEKVYSVGPIRDNIVGLIRNREEVQPGHLYIVQGKSSEKETQLKIPRPILTDEGILASPVLKSVFINPVVDYFNDVYIEYNLSKELVKRRIGDEYQTHQLLFKGMGPETERDIFIGTYLSTDFWYYVCPEKGLWVPDQYRRSTGIIPRPTPEAPNEKFYRDLKQLWHVQAYREVTIIKKDLVKSLSAKERVLSWFPQVAESAKRKHATVSYALDQKVVPDDERVVMIWAEPYQTTLKSLILDLGEQRINREETYQTIGQTRPMEYQWRKGRAGLKEESFDFNEEATSKWARVEYAIVQVVTTLDRLNRHPRMGFEHGNVVPENICMTHGGFGEMKYTMIKPGTRNEDSWIRLRLLNTKLSGESDYDREGFYSHKEGFPRFFLKDYSQATLNQSITQLLNSERDLYRTGHFNVPIDKESSIWHPQFNFRKQNGCDIHMFALSLVRDISLRFRMLEDRIRIITNILSGEHVYEPGEREKKIWEKSGKEWAKELAPKIVVRKKFLRDWKVIGITERQAKSREEEEANIARLDEILKNYEENLMATIFSDRSASDANGDLYLQKIVRVCLEELALRPEYVKDEPLQKHYSDLTAGTIRFSTKEVLQWLFNKTIEALMGLGVDWHNTFLITWGGMREVAKIEENVPAFEVDNEKENDPRLSDSIVNWLLVVDVKYSPEEMWGLRETWYTHDFFRKFREDTQQIEYPRTPPRTPTRTDPMSGRAITYIRPNEDELIIQPGDIGSQEIEDFFR
jgi:hypothetical protein